MLRVSRVMSPRSGLPGLRLNKNWSRWRESRPLSDAPKAPVSTTSTSPRLEKMKWTRRVTLPVLLLARQPCRLPTLQAHDENGIGNTPPRCRPELGWFWRPARTLVRGVFPTRSMKRTNTLASLSQRQPQVFTADVSVFRRHTSRGKPFVCDGMEMRSCYPFDERNSIVGEPLCNGVPVDGANGGSLRLA